MYALSSEQDPIESAKNIVHINVNVSNPDQLDVIVLSLPSQFFKSTSELAKRAVHRMPKPPQNRPNRAGA